MIISYSQIVGSDVLAVEEQQAIGRVSDIVIQKTDLKIKALVLSSPVFFIAPKIITLDDIIDFDKHMVIIQSADHVLPIKEVIPVDQAIKARLYGVKQKVFTKSKKYIGFVYDYTIESSSGMIYNLFVKHMLSDRIIPRTAIIEIRNKTVIIEDDFELIRNTATVPEAA